MALLLLVLPACGQEADSALGVALDGCAFEVDPNYTRVGDGEYVQTPCYLHEDSGGVVDYSACCPPPTVVLGLEQALVVCGY